MIKKLALLLAFGVSAQIYAADTCLIPNSGFVPVSCSIENDGGGADWTATLIKLNRSKLTMGLFLQDTRAILYNQKEKNISLESPKLQASQTLLDKNKNETNNPEKAIWSCYKQTNGSLSICIPVN